MDDSDKVLLALEEFNEKESGEIPSVLEEYLEHVATTGITQYPWPKLKLLVAQKLQRVISDFQKIAPPASTTAGVNSDTVSFEDMKSQLIEGVKKFTSAPFTIQRLCELLMKPSKHYKSTEKFMRGVEKNLLIVSTVDPQGNKIVKELPKIDCSSGSWATPFPVSQNPSLSSENQSPVTASGGSARSGRPSIFQSPWYAATGNRAPSPFDSPSLRGCCTTDGARRRPSPYPSHLHEPRKRLRVEISGDRDGGGGSLWGIPLFSCDESATPPPAVHSPILGHLLSDKDDDLRGGTAAEPKAKESVTAIMEMMDTVTTATETADSIVINQHDDEPAAEDTQPCVPETMDVVCVEIIDSRTNEGTSEFSTPESMDIAHELIPNPNVEKMEQSQTDAETVTDEKLVESVTAISDGEENKSCGVQEDVSTSHDAAADVMVAKQEQTLIEAVEPKVGEELTAPMENLVPTTSQIPDAECQPDKLTELVPSAPLESSAELLAVKTDDEECDTPASSSEMPSTDETKSSSIDSSSASSDSHDQTSTQ